MTLGIVNINLRVISKQPIIKNKLSYTVNKQQCNLFTLCNFFNNFFIINGNNNTMYSKNRIGNRNFYFKLPINIFFKLTQLT